MTVDRDEPSGGGSGSGDPHRVGSLVSGLLRRLGLTEGVARQGAVQRWEEVVGERIAAVTRPTGVSGEVLFVRVASSAWMTELNLMRHEILRRLNAGVREGRIEKIVFTLWEDPEGERRPLSDGAGPQGP